MLLACFSAVSKAQVAAGDVISGNVSDDIEPLMMVNVVEIDKNGRIVAHGVTDINGNFSFRCVSPKNKLKISYIGCQTQIIPIDKKYFKVKLASATQLKEVVIKSVKKTSSSGLAIPVTEVSAATQTISMKEFEGLGMTSVDEALQGRISGLDIVANSGNLGAGTTMRLRGVSTINGNANPLIVVNGNVFTNDSDADFDYTNANEERFAELLNVNPEDIEEITVLKDAASTAIWGSMGANGVIEIKTKRGSRGDTRVNYSYRFTGSWQPEGYKLLNGDDYTMYMKEAFFNPQLDNSFADQSSKNYIPEINYNPMFTEYHMFNDNTDWVDAVKQFGTNQQHYVSFTGGGEKANFRISGGYDRATGTAIKQELDRFTTRVALDYFVSDRISIRTNFDLTYTNNKKNYNHGGDLLGIAYTKMPNLSIYEEDEFGNDTDRFYTMNQYVTSPFPAAKGLLDDQYAKVNPVALAHDAKNEEKTINLSPEFILKYELLGTQDGESRLTYEGQVLFNIFNKDNNTYLPGHLLSSNFLSDSYNNSSMDAYKSHSLSTRHTLTFAPHFNNEDHSLLFMARSVYDSGNSTSQNVSKKWLPTSDITSSLGGGIISGYGSGSGEWRSMRFIFSLHYAYKGRYIFDTTLSRDGSTKFGPSKRWLNYPSVSLRWNISDEPWMEKFEWLDMLSIRPGWGIVGRQPGGDFLYMSKYGNGANYIGDPSVTPNNIRLSDLRPEKKETWNLGFDLGLFEGKYTADLSIYTQKTTDLLMGGYAIPSSSGYGSLAYKNAGSMRNNGWEFNVNGNRFVKAGKFSMDFNITFANNRNEILSMDPTILETMNADFGYNNGSYLSRVQLHNPLGSIYGFRYKGVYQYTDYSEVEVKGVSGPNAPVARDANGEVILNSAGNPKDMYFDYDGKRYEFVGGDAIYEDINYDGQINELDIVYLGSSLPKLTGGFGMKFHYDRWSLNLQFNYRYGNKVVNYGRMNIENMHNNNNMSRSINWRWHNEGDLTTMPRAVTGKTKFETFNYLGSDRFVEDASFLRLNYALLSYSFPTDMLKKWGLSSLKLNLTMNNLFCITKYSGADPEVAQAGFAPAGDSSRTPRGKSFTIGLNVGF